MVTFIGDAGFKMLPLKAGLPDALPGKHIRVEAAKVSQSEDG